MLDDVIQIWTDDLSHPHGNAIKKNAAPDIPRPATSPSAFPFLPGFWGHRKFNPLLGLANGFAQSFSLRTRKQFYPPLVAAQIGEADFADVQLRRYSQLITAVLG